MNHPHIFRHLTDQEKVDVMNQYQNELVPMIDLAVQYGISRQGIYKILKKAGVETSKALAGNITVSCSACGNQTVKKRKYFKKHKHHFCDKECYFSWLKHGNGNPYIQWRHGNRIARAIVGEHIALRPTDVVHHEDRSNYNNSLDNLRVFACNGDHISYHRGGLVPILWDGRTARK